MFYILHNKKKYLSGSMMKICLEQPAGRHTFNLEGHRLHNILLEKAAFSTGAGGRKRELSYTAGGNVN